MCVLLPSGETQNYISAQKERSRSRDRSQRVLCLNQPCYRVLQMGYWESELHWWALHWCRPMSWVLRTAMLIQLCPAVACVYWLAVGVHLSCLPAYQSLYKHCSLALSTGEATHHLMVPYCVSSCQ